MLTSTSLRLAALYGAGTVALVRFGTIGAESLDVTSSARTTVSIAIAAILVSFAAFCGYFAALALHAARKVVRAEAAIFVILGIAIFCSTAAIANTLFARSANQAEQVVRSESQLLADAAAQLGRADNSVATAREQLAIANIELSDARAVAFERQSQLEEEISGEGGSGVAGVGPFAVSLMDEVDRLEEATEVAQSRVDAAQSELQEAQGVRDYRTATVRAAESQAAVLADRLPIWPMMMVVGAALALLTLALASHEFRARAETSEVAEGRGRDAVDLRSSVKDERIRSRV